MPVLGRTLGVPLFQEQLMRVAMIAAGFSGGQAEALRRAMGSKRSEAKMAALTAALYEGMEKNGIAPEAADQIVRGITSFAQYGFPESHAISFALIAYASAYLKVHHPAVFYASLLNAWPMGFYQPATLVQDAKRHGVRVLAVDVNYSEWRCTIEDDKRPARTLRLGLRFVRGFGQKVGAHLLDKRQSAFFGSIGDVRRRCPGLPAKDFTSLAEIGAFASLEGRPTRREALWQVADLPAGRERLLGADTGEASPLEEMTLDERIVADFRGTGLTVGPHPMALHREALSLRGILRARDLATVPSGRPVKVAGVVIVRQRPETAKGFVFLTLEDESGLSNILVTPDVFLANRTVLLSQPVLVIEGLLQNERGAINVKAQRVLPREEAICPIPSRDFH